MSSSNNALVPTTPFDARFEREGEPIFIKLLVDASPSIDKIKDMLARSINSDFIGALQRVNEGERACIRVSASAFSNGYVDLWDGFLGLDQIAQNPINVQQLYDNALIDGTKLYNEPRRVRGTALFKATMQAYGELVTTAKAFGAGLHKWAQCKLLVLGDGASTEVDFTGRKRSDFPEAKTPEDVFQAITWKERGVKVQSMLFYFKTSMGLDRTAFGKMSAACGFDNTFFIEDHNTDPESLQREIRKVMGLLSNASLNRPTGGIVKYTRGDLMQW